MIAHDRGWLRRLREAVSQRPDRRSRGRAGAERRARQAAAPDRPLSARSAARPRPTSPIGCCINWRARACVCCPASCRRTPFWSRARWGPAALLDYDRARLRGLVLEEAGASSHIAIVARALAIPAVSDIPNISEIVEQGDAIIVDGVTGEMQLRPPPDSKPAYREKARLRARRQDQYRALRDTPAVTLRRRRDRPAYERRAARSICRTSSETGAQSIGLFRTELQFMLALALSAA